MLFRSREAHYLHGESWFRIYDEQPDYLDEAENALRYHLALRVMVTRLSSALRASEAERVRLTAALDAEARRQGFDETGAAYTERGHDAD